eukprot:COSAG01_NODE_1159_length_11469_cov_15.000352_12_plen_105_part_00
MLPFRLPRASGRQRLEEEEEEDEERLSKNESPLLWLRLLLTPALERGLSRSPPRPTGVPPLRGRLAEARTGGAARSTPLAEDGRLIFGGDERRRCCCGLARNAP